MRLNGKGRRNGAIRIEYVIAAVICFALLSGMTAVLMQYRQRLQMASMNRPTSVAPRQVDDRPSPAPTPSQTRQQSPQEPRRTEVTVQPAEPTRAQPTESRRPSVVVTEVTDTPQAPRPTGGSVAYPSGEPRVISPSGRTRIEAENYDLGGEGVAYHDTTSANSGGTYRPHERVDISLSQDSQGDHAVSFTSPGEWLNYSVSVRKSGSYRLQVRAARQEPGSGKLRILIDGVDKTGDLSLPSTGDYYKFSTTDAGMVDLPAGEHVLRIEMVSGDVNLNWIELTPTSPSTDTGSTTVVRVQPVDDLPQSTPPATPSVTVVSTSDQGVVTQENFDEIKVGQRPAGDEWSWSGTGSVTVQQSPGGNDRCLRLVDISRTGDCWVRQSFSEQKESVTFEVRVRFNAAASEFGLSLMDDQKQAIFVYTLDGEFGYEDDGGKWRSLAKFDANTWYNLRIEANVKDKNFRFFVDNVQAGGSKLKFRNSVGKINAWIGGTSPQLAGTMYLDNIRVLTR